jgi:diaminopimelate decarboxylase
VILDAGMNDLLRPALYDAYHPILPVAEPDPAAPQRAVDVVGPICESADVFARERELPPLQAHDLVAFGDAGAYGAVMASDYNSRPVAAEVLVEDDRFAVVRPRIEPRARFAHETLPSWWPATDLDRGAG